MKTEFRAEFSFFVLISGQNRLLGYVQVRRVQKLRRWDRLSGVGREEEFRQNGFVNHGRTEQFIPGWSDGQQRRGGSQHQSGRRWKGWRHSERFRFFDLIRNEVGSLAESLASFQ